MTCPATEPASPKPTPTGTPPKRLSQSGWWDKVRKGWKDDYGNIWVPDKYGHGKNRISGDGDHWDVQRGDGRGYINVGKDGRRWRGTGKPPKITDPTKEKEAEKSKVSIVVAVQKVVEVIAAPPELAGAWVPFPSKDVELR